MKRRLAIAYSLFAYLAFWLCAAYIIGFTADVLVPRSVDSGPYAEPVPALLGNLTLIAIFGMQHSLMAREGFKRAWRSVLPASIERSTYVLVSALTLALLYWGWRPIPTTVWAVSGVAAAALWAVFLLGWVIVVRSTFLISHGELMGLTQARHRGDAGQVPETPFRTPGLHRFVRHPLMFGFLLAFWASPHMTYGHLLLAAGMTAYIMIGVRFEERALVSRFGSAYRAYQQSTPMLIPWFRNRYARTGGRSDVEGNSHERPSDSVAPLY
jgi:methanethiol S-methyltransferase